MTTRPTTTRSTAIRRTAIAATTLLLLAGCGGEDPTSAPTAPVSEPAATATADPEPSAQGTTGDESSTTVVAIGESDLGPILVDEAGIALYVFDNDDVDTSACSDDCLATWPPLEASAVEAADGVEGDLGTFTRDDGTEQATVDGLPLYYFATDTAPGDVGGQGIGDVWWVVDATGAAVTGSPDESAPTGGSYGDADY